MLTNKPSEESVLIVGAGPSGLMMAHELLRLIFRCFDRQRTFSMRFFSRALAVQIRTLEIFSALGMLEALKEKSEALKAFEIYAEDRPPITIRPSPTSSSFLRPLAIDQSHTEEVLENHVKHLGVQIERGVELVGLSTTKTGVFASLKSSAGIEKAGPFAYVIGADGAHSFVEKKICP